LEEFSIHFVVTLSQISGHGCSFGVRKGVEHPRRSDDDDFDNGFESGMRKDREGLDCKCICVFLIEEFCVEGKLCRRRLGAKDNGFLGLGMLRPSRNLTKW
jgi:hypothetical protein